VSSTSACHELAVAIKASWPFTEFHDCAAATRAGTHVASAAATCAGVAGVGVGVQSANASWTPGPTVKTTTLATVAKAVTPAPPTAIRNFGECPRGR
jgi:hypothetical protein